MGGSLPQDKKMPSYSRKVALKGKSSQELYDKMSVDLERFLSKTPIGNAKVERFPEQKKLEAKSNLS